VQKFQLIAFVSDNVNNLFTPIKCC